MNQKQKMVLLFTAAGVGLMLIFPPYVVKGREQILLNSGYAFIFDLPTYFTHTGFAIYATINAYTLLVQIVAVLIIGGLIYLSLKKE